MGFALFSPFRAACPVLVALASFAWPVAAADSASGARPQYVSPRPDAQYVSAANNIVVRWGPALDAGVAADARFAVAGSRSGLHDGRVRLSDDGRTLVFLPSQPFSPSERVTVTLASGLRTRAGAELPGFTFAFRVSDQDPATAPRRDPLSSLREELPAWVTGKSPTPDPTFPATNVLPAGYPTLRVLASNNPPPGNLFLSPFRSTGAYVPGRLLIADNFGMPLFYRSLPATAWDFKRQPDGRMTYFTAPATFIALDTTGAVVDSFKARNGYEADAHDLQILPNGHALIAAYDWQPVDMSQIVPGGDPDAIVGGYIVQELDTHKNVVFQWSSWDHIPITDMIECDGTLLDPVIDYVHGNSIELDYDGNLLISCRHLNEITKIDRSTGEVMWRFGLNAKQNQFTIYQDDRGFSHQHDARRLPNGHITVFDNSNCFYPRIAGAMEYSLDEENKTATLVWVYRHSPPVDAPSMGNVQRLQDGGTVIGWGGSLTDVQVTEVHSDSTIAFELGYVDPPWYSYRTFRFPWGGAPITATPTTIDFGRVDNGYAEGSFTIHNVRSTSVTITEFASTDPQVTVTTPVPFTVPPGGDRIATVRYTPANSSLLAGRVYARSASGTTIVAAAVDVRGQSVLTVPASSPSARIVLLIGLLIVGLAALRLRRPEVRTPRA